MMKKMLIVVGLLSVASLGAMEERRPAKKVRKIATKVVEGDKNCGKSCIADLSSEEISAKENRSKRVNRRRRSTRRRRGEKKSTIRTEALVGYVMNQLGYRETVVAAKNLLESFDRSTVKELATLDRKLCTLLKRPYVDLKTLESLLDQGASVNYACPACHVTPLVTAAEMGHTEVCRILINRGAHVNVGSLA